MLSSTLLAPCTTQANHTKRCQMGPATNIAERNPEFGFDLVKDKDLNEDNTIPEVNGHDSPMEASLEVDSTKGGQPITSLAKDIRSKNAGPYEITFDIIFNDLEAFRKAEKSPALTPEALAPLWNARVEDVITCQFSEPAR